MKQWIFLIGAIVSEVAAALSLKAGMDDNPLFYIIVAVGYAAAFILLTKALKLGMALGVAYGIWGSSGVALTAVLSNLIFKEPLTAIMVAGIIVIIAGVLMIELGSQAASKKEKRNA
ncbi:MAG: small multidrug resistance pump [Patescibacteria group bacterium]|nr:small multidrug resistance pump [Patescibacteria group bacterium]